MFITDAPLDMRAPSGAYTAFYALFAVNMLGTLAWLAHRARREGTIHPLAALAGGLAVGAVVPPVYNALTKVWFPSNIPLPYVEAFGMKDPLFDMLGYALFIGFGGYLLLTQLRAGHGARAVYGTFLLWGVTDLLLEVPFLQWDLYQYYGDQPMEIGGFPLHWVVLNGFIPIAAGGLMYAVTDRWPGSPRGAAWRVAACPAVAGGLLMIPIFPVATALHADVPSAVRVGASLLSIAMTAAAVLAAARLADRHAGPTAPARSAGSLDADAVPALTV
ncbi:hypothetical protein [Paraconexibacter sp.]|uniref:hypothetical protein n=1 Tax=Paraconexibacter sp. TaxID=2949640 RepID=UPI003563FBAF